MIILFFVGGGNKTIELGSNTLTIDGGIDKNDIRFLAPSTTTLTSSEGGGALVFINAKVLSSIWGDEQKVWWIVDEGAGFIFSEDSLFENEDRFHENGFAIIIKGWLSINSLKDNPLNATRSSFVGVDVTVADGGSLISGNTAASFLGSKLTFSPNSTLKVIIDNDCKPITIGAYWTGSWWKDSTLTSEGAALNIIHSPNLPPLNGSYLIAQTDSYEGWFRTLMLNGLPVNETYGFILDFDRHTGIHAIFPRIPTDPPTSSPTFKPLLEPESGLSAGGVAGIVIAAVATSASFIAYAVVPSLRTSVNSVGSGLWKKMTSCLVKSTDNSDVPLCNIERSNSDGSQDTRISISSEADDNIGHCPLLMQTPHSDMGLGTVAEVLGAAAGEGSGVNS